MEDPSLAALLSDLKDTEPQVRDRATQQLWQRWYRQKGTYGFNELQRAEVLMTAGEMVAAEQLLSDLILQLPDFAEAWNRRAVLHYLQGRYSESLSDCDRVIELNSVHFGALHGKGLNLAALGQYREAIAAFRAALEIQPYALINQRLILECTARLT
ncbi:tetratricopeptide repeat protein [Synechococcus elongatus]|uniref:Tetratricopeptide repeat protein n=1 Tax=Synechococcus elongatus PCC 11802 TaxID=2283154 RepID=A0AAT9JQI7_SYNEL|nr:tetratricopeptide repeat protein [Synechococcus elongatus]QFZ92745.1 tetratricopeptide repeat protein [Synechococcus elongatus PCC 11802]